MIKKALLFALPLLFLLASCSTTSRIGATAPGQWSRLDAVAATTTPKQAAPAAAAQAEAPQQLHAEAATTAVAASTASAVQAHAKAKSPRYIAHQTIPAKALKKLDKLSASAHMPRLMHSATASVPAETNTLAAVALGLGLLAIVSLIGSIVIGPLLILSFLSAIGAIVTGAVACGEIKKNPGKYSGRGMAIAGLVLGIVTLSLMLLVLALVVVAVLLIV